VYGGVMRVAHRTSIWVPGTAGSDRSGWRVALYGVALIWTCKTHAGNTSFGPQLGPCLV